jgi:uncharacterized protein YegL
VEDSHSTVNEDDRLMVLAFYIVVDVSYSMKDGGCLDAANELVTSVWDAVQTNPVLADLVRISVIDFSDEAQVIIPLGDLRNVEHLPRLAERGGTSYAAAFRRLRQEIAGDIKQLKDDGYKVYRPTVFFITDGAPTDDASDLQTAFQDLTAADFKARPNLIPFGVGAATKEILDPWVFPQGRMRAYAQKEGVAPSAALNSLAEILVGSIIASTNSVDEQGQAGGLVLPDDDDLDNWI